MNDKIDNAFLIDIENVVDNEIETKIFVQNMLYFLFIIFEYSIQQNVKYRRFIK